MITGEKLLQQFGDVSINLAFATAMQKIRAVLRSSDKDFIETLEESISVHRIQSGTEHSQEFPNRFISNIQVALVNRQVINLEYYAHHSAETTTRQVEPIGLSFLSGSWHLLAWCRLRKAVRDFRVDRIKSMNILDETFTKNKHPKLDELAHLFLNPKELQRMVIRVDNGFVKEASQMKAYLGWVEETKHATFTEMVFYYPSVSQFARWMLMWGEHIRIIEPRELHTELSSQIKALHKQFTSI